MSSLHGCQGHRHMGDGGHINKKITLADVLEKRQPVHAPQL